MDISSCQARNFRCHSPLTLGSTFRSEMEPEENMSQQC